jgi:hypothetical protein
VSAIWNSVSSFVSSKRVLRSSFRLASRSTREERAYGERYSTSAQSSTG